MNSPRPSARKALPIAHRLSGGARHGAISALAALIAYLPTRALGLQEGFWSAITAIAVVQMEFHATETTARDQFIGAGVGGVTALCALLAFGPHLSMALHLAVYGAAIIAAMAACWAINAATASRLSGTTATIILLVPHSGPPWAMFESRIGEVGWGVSVAVATVWLAARLLTRPDAQGS
ncbi:MAG: FUSC family protein [Steroidobacteraceae bacterium]|jgi:uncharacterized membrane protein YccC